MTATQTTFSTGVRRVVTCLLPTAALERLLAGEAPAPVLAREALLRGLERSSSTTGTGWFSPWQRLAVPLDLDALAQAADVATERFGGDAARARGWLIARGLGLSLLRPVAEPRLPMRARPVAPAVDAVPLRPARTVKPKRPPLPPDDSAPSGPELQQRRIALDLSQRQFAFIASGYGAGLSRGQVASIECGYRPSILGRSRYVDALTRYALELRAARK